MRWLAFFILAYVILGIQTGVDAFVRIERHGSVLAEVNFVLLAVVFVAINAPRDAALIACFTLGAMQDLVTQQGFGLFAFSYGLFALVLTGAAQAVYREHPLTHFAAALAGGLLTGLTLIVHGWMHPAGRVTTAAGQNLPSLPHATLLVFGGVVYTAVLAPFVVGFLQRYKKAFGFQPGRRKIRAW